MVFIISETVMGSIKQNKYIPKRMPPHPKHWARTLSTDKRRDLWRVRPYAIGSHATCVLYSARINNNYIFSSRNSQEIEYICNFLNVFFGLISDTLL